MEKDRVSPLLKAGGWLDIAAFVLTVLLAALTIFSLVFTLRAGPVEDAMAAAILSFVFVMAAVVESSVLAALLALGCVGLAFGIRALRAAKKENPCALNSVRAFPVFALIHLALFAVIGWLCCLSASEWYTLLPLLLCLAADLGCLAASFAVKMVIRARLKRQAAGFIGANADALCGSSETMR